MSKKGYFSGTVMLVLCALFWGTTFLAQGDAMQSMGPFTFSAFRSLIGALLLFIWHLITKKKEAFLPFKKENFRLTLTGGITCGVILFIAANLQNIGLKVASPGKAAFITSLYILIVPIIGLFIGKRPSIIVWLCCAISVIGFYMLNVDPSEGFGISIWEIVILICAVFFSFHIYACEKYGAAIDPVLLSCIQFTVVSMLSFIFIFFDVAVLDYSLPSLEMFSKTWFSVLYAALFSSALAYTLQIAGQKRVPPTAAVLLMSLESVFAVASDWLINKNALSFIQTFGCVLIFCAICVSQIPFEHKTKNTVD